MAYVSISFGMLAVMIFAWAGATYGARMSMSHQRATIMKGICYAPVATKTPGDQPAVNDFMSNEYMPLWGDQGRADLATMSKLGANAIRVYGNDPREDHTDFLDTAHKYGLTVVPEVSDYPFIDYPGRACGLHDFDCYSVVKEHFAAVLAGGFAKDGAYHPALKEVNLINEPEIKMNFHEPAKFVKAIISALDGMLDAEKEAGITGNLPKFTATFTTGVCRQCKKYSTLPGLGQMYDLKAALLDPESVHYKPKNDLKKAFEQRWVNSLNTAMPAFALQQRFIPDYKLEFGDDGVEWYIGEYHAIGSGPTFNVLHDLNAILEIAKDKTNLLQGISFFEWQVAYVKGGYEQQFGMLALGDRELQQFSPFGHDASVWCLESVPDAQGSMSLDKSVTEAYGGEGYDFSKNCGMGSSKDEVNCVGVPCAWTAKWNCPGQPKGTRGQARDDGSVGYKCCCEGERWRASALAVLDEEKQAKLTDAAKRYEAEKDNIEREYQAKKNQMLTK